MNAEDIINEIEKENNIKPKVKNFQVDGICFEVLQDMTGEQIKMLEREVKE
jgi:hypothetical protein